MIDLARPRDSLAAFAAMVGHLLTTSRSTRVWLRSGGLVGGGDPVTARAQDQSRDADSHGYHADDSRNEPSGSEEALQSVAARYLADVVAGAADPQPGHGEPRQGRSEYHSPGDAPDSTLRQKEQREPDRRESDHRSEVDEDYHRSEIPARAGRVSWT